MPIMTKAPEPGGNDAAGRIRDVEQYLVKDPERFALNLARMIEQAGKAAAAWAEPREKGEVRDSVAEPIADMVKTFSKLTEYWLSDPARALEAQTRLFSGYLNVWANAISRAGSRRESRRMPIKPERGDKRFQDPEWGRNAFFDFLKQAYLVTSRWAGDLVEHADGLDEHTRHKAGFYVKQIANAISPSNFILTNPELFRETVASERREPGARHEDAGRGHRGRQGRPEAQAGRLFALRDRQEHRDDARQGGRPQRRRRDHPVRAGDRDGAEAAAADLPALDQQVLHPRPQPGKILHPLGGRAGPHGVRHLLGQPRRAPRHEGLGGLYPRRARNTASTRSSRRPASARSTPSAIASAARCLPRRLP